MKRFIYIIVLSIALVAGFLYLTKPKTTNAPGSTAGASNHQRGDGTKNVTLIEYGDFQCPACGAYYPLVKQVAETYKDKVNFQFRNFPLDQIHQNARAASRAAEAASIQGKFWEMHDMLYENQKDWEAAANPTVIFEGYATNLGLDTAKFKADYSSGAVNAIINADIKEGQKLKASSTPTFVLDGVKIENPRDVQGFNTLIDAEIAKKNPTTTPVPTPATPTPTPAP